MRITTGTISRMPCKLLVLLLFTIVQNIAAQGTPSPGENGQSGLQPGWTIMFYIRGDNTLECEALKVFNQLSASPDSSYRSVFVELGRMGSPCDGYEDWQGIRRFNIRQGMLPTEQSACVPEECGYKKDEDMGQRNTLEGFVRWGVRQAHREHLMLVMWGHGDATTIWFQIYALSFVAASTDQSVVPADFLHVPAIEGISAISGSPSSPLNLDDVKEALTSVVSPNQLDVLVLDACNMGSIEASYELAPAVQLLVADERTHNPGLWDYASFLNTIGEFPRTAVQAAGAVHDAFTDQFTAALGRKLTVVSTDDVGNLVGHISDLAQDLSAPESKNILSSARKVASEQTLSGIPADRIDLGRFLEAILSNPQISGGSRVKAQMAYQELQHVKAILPADPPDDFLSVYFPENYSQWHGDTDLDKCTGDGQHPLAFVCHTCWYNLFQDYFSRPRTPPC
jgi:hypothetical protein